jgi:hypothetical protein
MIENRLLANVYSAERRYVSSGTAPRNLTGTTARFRLTDAMLSSVSKSSHRNSNENSKMNTMRIVIADTARLPEQMMLRKSILQRRIGINENGHGGI